MSPVSSQIEPSYGKDAPVLSEQSGQGEFYLPVSHVQLLEKLEHLSRYSHFVQVVVAVSGAGKSTLMRQFMPSADDSSVHGCSITATEGMAAGELLAELVEQLSIDLAMTASDEEKLQALYKHADLLQDISRQFLIVVDDAEHLSEEAMDLLLNLLLSLRNPESRPHLVFFATPKIVELLERPRFQSVVEGSCHFVELDPLSYAEMEVFLRHRYASLYPRLNEAQLKRLHNESFGLPGRVPKVMQNLLEGRAAPTQERSSQWQFFPRAHLVVGAVLLVAVGFGGWLFYPAVSTLDEQRVRVELASPTQGQAPTELTANVADTAPVLSLQEKLAQAEQRLQRTQVVEAAKEAGAVEITVKPEALPDPLPATKPVVKAPEVAVAQLAPAAVKEQPMVPVRRPSAEASEEQPPAASPRKLVLKLPSSPVVEAAPAVAPAPVAATAATSFLKEKELLSWAPGGYTLQVLGARKEQSVLEFIRGHNNDANLYYFSTLYKDKPWYVVVYGQYRNRDLALAAIAELPRELRERRPWARSVLGVQDDIRRKK